MRFSPPFASQAYPSYILSKNINGSNFDFLLKIPFRNNNVYQDHFEYNYVDIDSVGDLDVFLIHSYHNSTEI